MSSIDDIEMFTDSSSGSGKIYNVEDVDIGDLVFRKRGRSGSRVWGPMIDRLKSIGLNQGVGIRVNEGEDPEKVRNRVTQAVQNQVVNSMSANERESIRFRVRLTEDLKLCIVSKHKREVKVVEQD